jgi:hypothetical protein
VIRSIFPSRRAFLAAARGLVLASPSLPPPARRVGGEGGVGTPVGAPIEAFVGAPIGPPVEVPFCSSPNGPDAITTPLATPLEVLTAACGRCVELSVLAARRTLDASRAAGRPVKIEMCITVSDDPEEHMFLRVDGRIRDPAQEAGMPVREVGAFLAEPVWPP